MTVDTKLNHSPAAGRPIRTGALHVVQMVALPIIGILLWQYIASVEQSPFFSTPLSIVKNIYTNFFSGPPSHLFLSELFLRDALPTIVRMLIGYFLAIVVGLVIGTLMGLLRSFSDVVSPVVEFLRSIPTAAALPLFVILLGGNDGMRVALIAFGTVWFVLINTANGVGSIHPMVLDVGRSFRISKSAQLFRIILPAAMPKIFSGLRIATSAALIFAVISEFMFASNGIGYRLVISQQRFETLNLWSWIVLLGVLGLLLNAILAGIEHRVLAWHKLSRSR